MKVLYVFAGKRTGKFVGEPGVDYPDTQLYGLNHLKEFGIDAEFKEPGDLLSGPLAHVLGFRLRHFFMFFGTFGYDVVFGSATLYMLFWKKFIPRRTKFVLFNFGLTGLLESNAAATVKGRIIRWLLKEADAVVCVSSVQKAYLERECPALKGKLYVVFLAVDVGYYQADMPRRDFFIAAGRDNGRDYATLIEAARLLPERKFEIACSERNLKGIGEIPPNVTVHLDLPFLQLKEKYETARALLLITHGDYRPGTADCSGQTVLLEAFAAGLPVIASKKDYLPEYAEEGKEILTVGFYEPNDISAKVRRLDDAALRASLGQAARRKAERLFSTRSLARSLADIFSTVTDIAARQR